MTEATARMALETLVLATVVGLGVQVFMRGRRVPAVIPLLVLGVALGPHGAGLIHPGSLGDGLPGLTALCIAVILFEAGLHLEPAEDPTEARLVRRLVTLSVLVQVTLLAGLCVWWLDLSIETAVVAGALMVITGPTVVLPLLRHARLDRLVERALVREAVLLEPIGVFFSLLCFEWALAAHEGGAAWRPLATLAVRAAAGVGLGVIGAAGLTWVARSTRISLGHRAVLICVAGLGLFTVAERFAHHAGLLAVLVAAVLLGRRLRRARRPVADVAARLAELAIGLLFLLVTASLDPSGLLALGLGGVGVVLAAMFVVRPISVSLCALGLDIAPRARALLSWVAPRGVVTASLAALFATEGARAGMEDMAILAPLVLSLVAATVILQGGTCRPLGRALGLAMPPTRAWLVVGAGTLGSEVARALGKRGVEALVVDSNVEAVRGARDRGLRAVHVEVLDAERLGSPLGEFDRALVTLTDPVRAEAVVRELEAARPTAQAFTWDALLTDDDEEPVSRACAHASLIARNRARLSVLPAAGADRPSVEPVLVFTAGSAEPARAYGWSGTDAEVLAVVRDLLPEVEGAAPETPSPYRPCSAGCEGAALSSPAGLGCIPRPPPIPELEE